MPKLRVYQLARELNRDNSEVIRELQHMGVPVTSHSNTVEDRVADVLRKTLGVYSGDSPAASDEDSFHVVESDSDDSIAVVDRDEDQADAPAVEVKADTKPEAAP